MPSDGGLEALRRAAADGDLTASAFTAVLAGLGAGEPQDWSVALERLARAADLGSASARGQLEVLSAGSAEDLEPWLRPAPVRRLHPASPTSGASCRRPPAAG
jgi:TPR repeat protein